MTTTAFRALVLVVALATAAQSQSARDSSAATIEGRVVDAKDRPLRGVTVELLGVAETRTDSAGAYRFSEVAPGVYLLRLRQLGLAPVLKTISIVAGGRVTADGRLDPGAQVLDRVVVRADTVASPALAGWMARRRAGQGTVITAEDIERRHATSTDQILRTIPGLTIDTAGIAWVSRGRQTIVDLQAARVDQYATCIGVQVVIDGVAMPQPYKVTEIVPGSIRAVELYLGAATTPPELRTGKTTCGTLAIWTR